MIQPITGCAFDTFDMYKDSIKEDLRDPKTRKMQGGESDVDDLSGCQVKYELGRWRAMEGKFWSGTWNRSSASIDGTMISEGNLYLDSPNKINSSKISKQSYPVYIGPWHPITLTRTEGSFFNKKKITEQKTIRFFAYQKTEGGPIKYQYESMSDANKDIPAKPFSLSPSGKIAPDKFSLCAVKWVAKYGYNAVYDQKTKKIIEAKE